MKLEDWYDDDELREDPLTTGQVIRGLFREWREKRRISGGRASERRDDDKAEKKRKQRINKICVTVWRIINWLCIYALGAGFIRFLFEESFLLVLPMSFPGIPWESSFTVILFVFCACVALLASLETNKDDFRFASGSLIVILSTILPLLVGRKGTGSLWFAGIVIFSVYAEKIFTDSKVRRTPPKKKRIERHSPDGEEIVDIYDV